jgi:hypothetical protein
MSPVFSYLPPDKRARTAPDVQQAAKHTNIHQQMDYSNEGQMTIQHIIVAILDKQPEVYAEAGLPCCHPLANNNTIFTLLLTNKHQQQGCSRWQLSNGIVLFSVLYDHPYTILG